MYARSRSLLMTRSRREAARRIFLLIPAPAETETQKIPGDVFVLGHDAATVGDELCVARDPGGSTSTPSVANALRSA
jgi:hypothetical protein